MTDIPIVNDITALGLLALVLILGYYTLNKLFHILTEHLQKMVNRQDRMIELLGECLENRSIRESFQNLDDD
jgi:hypothetical protein